MENLAPPGPDARFRLTHDQAQELVQRTVATHSESLLRTARRHSLCADDAHDAFQRSMEIFLRRARTLDPETAHRWLDVVVKHESMEVRRARTAAVNYDEVDFNLHSSPHAATPEERALGADRTTRATEALKRLKPQELRAMWLKALGHSYAEISEATGYSATKVNRCLAEGRKSFLDRYEGIESGRECERWRPVLASMAAGEASAAQITDARPHLRNCSACRATLRGPRRSFAAMLPFGLTGLLGRALPNAAGADAAGGAKLAAVLAAGATATGGGLVVAQETRHDRVAERATTAAPAARRPVVAVPRSAPRHTVAPHVGTPRRRAGRVVARRSTPSGRIEFTPRGSDAGAFEPPIRAAPTAARASVPHARPAPAQPGADSVRGEFSPQP